MQFSQAIHVVNAHCEGVVCDVVVGGMPRIKGTTVLEKKLYFEQELDHLRTLLCLEPRGAETQNTNVLVEPAHPDAEFGFLTLEKDEIVEMSGGNVISVATVLLETGMLPKQEPITEFGLETPAGLITVRAAVSEGRVQSIEFTNQPAFVLHRDAMIEVPDIGQIRVDVVWGGMWYVVVDAADLGLELTPKEHKEVVRLGELVKSAARAQLPVEHPANPALADFIQGTLIAGPLSRTGSAVESRNAVVVSPGFVDRCPCGTGTSGRLALLHARGQVSAGDTFNHDSLIGTRFESRIIDTDQVGALPAVVPTIRGRAWISGTQQIIVDPTDPFPHGFSMDTLGAGAVSLSTS